MWGLTKGFQSYAPFWSSYLSIKEKGCVSNFFHNFQVIPTCYIRTLWRVDVHHILFMRLDTDVPKLCPFFGILIPTYREIFFHGFQVINMGFFMCWLIYCDKEGIGDNIFYIKTNFICNLQHAFELFGNGSWVFQNSLNAGDSGVLWPPGPLTKTLPWIHFGPCNPQAPNIIFRFSSFGNFHPCFCHHQEQQDLIYLLELHVY